MPVINRVVAKPQLPMPGNGVVSRIAALQATKVGHLKTSIYGLPKTGKTRLACTFPKPLLIIGFEDGTASVVGTKGVDFVQLIHCSEFPELVDHVATSGKYATVVVDNGTKMRDMRISEILLLSKLPMQKGWGFASRETWGECTNSLKELLDPLMKLPNKMKLNVVVIAQEQNFTSEEEGQTASDIMKPAIGSALGKSLCLWLSAECDYVCHTFIREQTIQGAPLKIAGREIPRMTKTGKKEFCLLIGPDASYITGFRVPLGAPDPPDVIVNPDYFKIEALVRGGSVPK